MTYAALAVLVLAILAAAFLSDHQAHRLNFGAGVLCLIGAIGVLISIKLGSA